METRLSVIIGGIVVIIAAIAFLVYRNMKDEKDMEEKMDATNENEFKHSRKEDEEKM